MTSERVATLMFRRWCIVQRLLDGNLIYVFGSQEILLVSLPY
jgi:hypothetical protein